MTIPQYLSIADAARLLDTSSVTLTNHARRNDGVIVRDGQSNAPLVTAQQINRRWLVPISEMAEITGLTPGVLMEMAARPPEPKPKKETQMPNTPVRATLSTGCIICTVRTEEPLTSEQWAVVTQLAEAVREAADKLPADE